MRPSADIEPEEGEDKTVFVDRSAFAEEADSVPQLKSKTDAPASPHPTTPLPKAGETVRIGRDATNTIVFPNKDVSRFHAEIIMRDDEYIVNNWKSTNGTFVNGKKVESHALKSGDKIEIGDYDILFDGAQLLQLGIRPKPVEPEVPAEIADEVKPLRTGRWIAAGLAMVACTFMIVSHFVSVAEESGPHPLRIVISGQVALQPNDADLQSVDLSVGFPDLKLVVPVPHRQVEWHFDGSYIVRLAFQSPRTPQTARVTASRKGYGEKHVDDLKLAGHPLACRVPKLVLKANEPISR